MAYHLRVDGTFTHEEQREFYDHFLEIYKIDVYFAYHEYADVTGKPHFHAHLECDSLNTEKEVRAARKRIKDYFDLDGGRMSFTRDRGNSRKYTVKQKRRVFFRGITAEELDELEGQSYVSTKPEKEKKDSGMSKVYDQFFKDLESDVERLSKGRIDRVEHQSIVDKRYVVNFIIRYYHSIAHKSFGIGRMAEATNYVYMRYLYEHKQVYEGTNVYLETRDDIADMIENYYLR